MCWREHATGQKCCLRRAVDGNGHKQRAFIGAHLRDVDMGIADCISLELSFRLAASGVGQTCDAEALKDAVKAQSGQVRDWRFQGVEALIEWQSVGLRKVMHAA